MINVLHFATLSKEICLKTDTITFVDEPLHLKIRLLILIKIRKMSNSSNVIYFSLGRKSILNSKRFNENNWKCSVLVLMHTNVCFYISIYISEMHSPSSLSASSCAWLFMQPSNHVAAVQRIYSCRYRSEAPLHIRIEEKKQKEKKNLTSMTLSVAWLLKPDGVSWVFLWESASPGIFHNNSLLRLVKKEGKKKERKAYRRL